MAGEPNLFVVDFLITAALARFEQYQGVALLECSQGVAIFDELDSLTAEEFALIYALYLLGSGAKDNPDDANQTALAAAFSPLELMSSDANLHVALSQGLERWY